MVLIGARILKHLCSKNLEIHFFLMINNLLSFIQHIIEILLDIVNVVLVLNSGLE